ncbi:MAG: Crp/Fnr family transcriptional regulator [Acidobacteria bacterium]|nr:Crp/Fnr family transcriptional regulator [Acidobacteriota bacterium]
MNTATMQKAKNTQRVKPILATASDELKASLTSHANARHYFPNEELFAVGERADYLPIIESGRVKMVQFPEPGKEVIIGIFGAGEMFAIPPVVDGDVYPASAYAIEESEILLLHRDDVFQLLAKSPEFTLALLNWMSSMLRQKTALIKTLAGGSAEQRIAGVLVRLFSASSDEPPIKIKLRREDIARMAGLTTETTIRTIRHLAAVGDIRIVRGKILIDSLDGLASHLEG